jgi:cytochrome c556
MTRLQTFLALAVLSILFSAPAAMAQSNENYIEYRQKVMGANGAAMGAIGDIIKNKLPLSGNIADHARVVNINAKLIASAFKHDASEGKTDAKSEIWKDWAKFEEAAKKLETASAKLAEAGSKGDMAAIGDAIKGVGGACKGCHDDFRKPKEQSYKNVK